MTGSPRTFARIAGPAILAVAITEWLNLPIFAAPDPMVVYLNGTLLFLGGVTIIQAHNRWGWGWPLLVTLTGWLISGLGLSRMVFPRAAAPSGLLVHAILVAVVALGVCLSWIGYSRNAGR